ncbi:hypothetical protein ACXVUM_06540 [Williamsia sp. SKLECPSW1]
MLTLERTAGRNEMSPDEVVADQLAAVEAATTSARAVQLATSVQIAGTDECVAGMRVIAVTVYRDPVLRRIVRDSVAVCGHHPEVVRDAGTGSCREASVVRFIDNTGDLRRAAADVAYLGWARTTPRRDLQPLTHPELVAIWRGAMLVAGTLHVAPEPILTTRCPTLAAARVLAAAADSLGITTRTVCVPRSPIELRVHGAEHVENVLQLVLGRPAEPSGRPPL